MRSIIIVIVFILLIASTFFILSSKKQMVVLKKGNIEQKVIPIKKGFFQDAFCGMIIDDINYSSEVIHPDGRTWFFHDHADFIQWLENKPFRDKVKIYVYAKDIKKYILAKNAYYSVNEKTPMESGFGAYSKYQKGRIDFDTFRLRVLRNETMANLAYKKIIEREMDGK